jgi:hypothetical protein
MQFCPSVDQGQMDLFGVSLVPVPAETESIGRNDTTHVKQTSAHPSERVSPETRLLQLPLGLPAQALNDYSWSPEECVALLDAMLCDQLRLLADERTTAEMRADLIAWVAAPKMKVAELRNAPFSFQMCCAAAGVDFEEMRERTLEMFAPALLDQLD